MADLKPAWFDGIAPSGSYRSLFKWGAADKYKHPNQAFISYIRSVLNLTEDEFQPAVDLGLEVVDVNVPTRIPPEDLQTFEQIVGSQNLCVDTYTRVHVAYGGSMLDALRLRRKIIENLPDAVVYPRNREDVEEILKVCTAQKIPVYVYGGGSSVTRGTEAVCGGICLDLSRHMNQIVSFNELDQTITVQPGIQGPELERALNHAPEVLHSTGAFTLGHFPQSFEFSSVGGWVVTRGAGQNSTYYGKIEDMVISQEYVFPGGILRTGIQPRAAVGPDLDQIMMGSEGAFGILTEVTLKVSRYWPQNTRRFSYLFRSWDSARSACRQIMQGEFGFPSIFRLSDPEETDAALHMYNIHGTPADSLLRSLGYQPMQRCLLIGSADGESSAARLIHKKVSSICQTERAFPLAFAKVTERWEHSRFTDPYMRDDLHDYGILIDTLECGVTWSQMDHVHQVVREYVKSRPETICLGHLSHAYPQGGNLYFIFITRMSSIRNYLEFQYGILDAIQKSGASMSHHHGIGKQTGPWLEEQIGTSSMDVIRALKKHFDPQNILNPGGTLGLDMSVEQADKLWGFDLDN